MKTSVLKQLAVTAIISIFTLQAHSTVAKYSPYGRSENCASFELNVQNSVKIRAEQLYSLPYARYGAFTTGKKTTLVLQSALIESIKLLKDNESLEQRSDDYQKLGNPLAIVGYSNFKITKQGQSFIAIKEESGSYTYYEYGNRNIFYKTVERFVLDAQLKLVKTSTEVSMNTSGAKPEVTNYSCENFNPISEDEFYGLTGLSGDVEAETLFNH